ncbi:MAG: TGS domain-containing protein, partial [Candidatus Bathyarchaeia archaeon]
LPNSKENIALLKDYLDAEWQGLPLLVVSCLRNEGLKDLGKILFRMLEIIRVYTKEPSSKEPSERPLIVKKGTSVIDVAKKLHSEIYKGFKYARIWGPSAKYPGERVGPSHILMDGDIVEIHC